MADMMTDVNKVDTDKVVFADGTRGVIVSVPVPGDPDGTVEVMLESGQSIIVPADVLVLQESGFYQVAVSASSFGTQTGPGQTGPGQTGPGSEDMQVIALAEETLAVGKREVETGRVRFRTQVTERAETVDQPLLRTEVSTRRVEVNQFVDTPPAVRYEGDTMIVPILEEVLVVEKRLRVKEEVYITQVQTEHHEPQTVTLRTETLVEERLPTEDTVSV